jgi:prepilin signal peptidase PulO-like enzyme (type II secretory pathway)
LDKKVKFFQGRSRCPRCHKLISWYDNIPVLSFILLFGKCRHCHKPISWQYPLVEFFCGLIFLINSYVFLTAIDLINFYPKPVLNFLAADVFVGFLIVIFVYDLKKFLILDQISVPLIIIAFFYNLLFNFSFINLLIGGIIGIGFFLAQYLISRGKWIGDGDLRLGLAMGFILGYPKILLAILISYLIGSAVAIFLLIFKRKKMQSRVPFGPFLALGTYLVMIFGDYLINKFYF